MERGMTISSDLVSAFTSASSASSSDFRGVVNEDGGVGRVFVFVVSQNDRTRDAKSFLRLSELTSFLAFVFSVKSMHTLLLP